MRYLFSLVTVTLILASDPLPALEVADVDLSALPEVDVRAMARNLAADSMVRAAEGDDAAQRQAVLDALERAYRRAGWIAATVSMTPGHLVEVSLGERFRCGPIHVQGDVGDEMGLRRLLTQTQGDTLSPAWNALNWAPADVTWLTRAQGLIQKHIQDQGFFDSVVQLSIQPSDGGQALLLVDIQSGSQQALTQLSILGEHGYDDQEELADWVMAAAGFALGDIADRELLQRARLAVRESARFLSADLRYHPDSLGEGRELALTLTGWKGMPRVDDPDPEALLAVRRLLTWLDQSSEDEPHALRGRLNLVNIGLDIEADIRLGQGLKLQVHAPLPLGLAVDDHGVALRNPATDSWYRLPLSEPIRLRMDAFYSATAPGPDEDKPTNNLSFLWAWSRTGPIGVNINAPPGPLLTGVLRIDEDRVPDVEDGGTRWAGDWGRLGIGPDGAFDIVIWDNGSEEQPLLTLHHHRWQSPVPEEVASTQQLAAAIYAIWEQAGGELMNIRPQLRPLEAVLTDVDRIEDWLIGLAALWDWADSADRALLIPRHPDDDIPAGVAVMMELAAAAAARRWQPEDWPRRLIDGAVAVVGHDGAAMNTHLQGLMSDATMGPIGNALVAHGLTFIGQQRLAAMFQQRALDTIAGDRLLADLTLLMGGVAERDRFLAGLDWSRAQRLLPPARRAEGAEVVDPAQRLALLWESLGQPMAAALLGAATVPGLIPD